MDFYSESQFKTPILFLVFNRPDTTKQVFESIRQVKPKHLYLASDGARATKTGEKDIVESVRNYVLSNIDWECDVKILFRDENLGCRRAVNGAIDWFFENEEMGIILEDDCLPSQSFFRFCEEMLEKYKLDTRIMCISGDNFFQDRFDFNVSYLFSEVPLIWGWASWRRAWVLNRPVYENFNQLYPLRVSLSSNQEVNKMWWRRIGNTINNKIDTWDYLWTFTNLINNGLTIIPKRNLVKNIGVGHLSSTHTNKVVDKSIIPASEIEFPLVHPALVKVNYNFDQKLYENFFNVNPIWKRGTNKLTEVTKYIIMPALIKMLRFDFH